MVGDDDDDDDDYASLAKGKMNIAYKLRSFRAIRELSRERQKNKKGLDRRVVQFVKNISVRLSCTT